MADPEQAGTWKAIEDQGGVWDKVIEVAFPVAGAMGASWLSPEVAAAGGDGWWGVFFATLTWSLGCAGATFAVVRGIKPPELYWWFAGSPVAALFIASVLGVGVLDVWPAFAEGTGPPFVRIPLAFFVTAFITYGFVGSFVSGGIGIWLGYHAANRVTAAMGPAR